MEEAKALVRIISRLDKDQIDIEKTKARKKLRAEASAARLDSDDTRRGVTLSYHHELARIRGERRAIGVTCAAAVKQSDADITASWSATREAQAAAGTIGLAISHHDQGVRA